MQDIGARLDEDTIPSCVLLFSGGRDSTVAALRLANRCLELKLVTVSTPHLSGLDRVIRRLHELKRVVDPGIEWHHFTYDREPDTGAELLTTCLPCHSVYAAAGIQVADASKISQIAFGYTGYQSTWAEQTPSGRRELAKALSQLNKTVLFPVADLNSKEEAIAALRAYRIADFSLEQKCGKQQFNSNAGSDRLESEIGRWGESLAATLADHRAADSLHLTQVVRLSDVREDTSCFRII